MSWAARRRFIIVSIISAIALAFLATLSIATFYQAPSCTDSKQNQGEQGVDCGGACSYLCTEQQQPPTVLFTAALMNPSGRADVVALIENKNRAAAAKNVPYRVSVYDASHSLLQEVTGVIDLPAGAQVPVFVPGITTGKQTGTSAFLTIDAAAPRWFTLTSDPRLMPVVTSTVQSATGDAPRIEAVLTNPSVTVLSNVKVIVVVYNAKDDVIAASQTVVQKIPAQGSAPATFTWNAAFPAIPARIQVVPIIPLP